MPELHFRIRWPDGRVETCYSPSTILREHLTAGTRYPLADFVARSREGLSLANERVRMKFGMGCSRAMGQLASIETAAAAFTDTPRATVLVEAIGP